LTEIIEAMARPERNGTPPLPKRGGPKGLLPSTWLGRSVRLEYSDCFGSGREASGVLLDVCATGPILLVAGTRTILAWDRLAMLELCEDR
jgi:hypothetical protein